MRLLLILLFPIAVWADPPFLDGFKFVEGNGLTVQPKPIFTVKLSIVDDASEHFYATHDCYKALSDSLAKPMAIRCGEE